MRDEFEGTQKIRQALDHGVSNLDEAVTDRLSQARRNALDHQRLRVRKLKFAGGMGTGETSRFHPRRWVAVAALTLGMVSTYYWDSFEPVAENEEVDSALLTDDLPIDAYTDHGFQAWLELLSQLLPQQ